MNLAALYRKKIMWYIHGYRKNIYIKKKEEGNERGSEERKRVKKKRKETREEVKENVIKM